MFLQEEIERCWGVKAFILDILEPLSGDPRIAIAEIPYGPGPDKVRGSVIWTKLEVLVTSSFLDEERLLVRDILHGYDEGRGPLSRPGWIHEALNWIQRETSLGSDADSLEFRQWNASSNAVLFEVRSHTGTPLWLKAVDPARSNEYRVTHLLASLFPDSLPRIITSRPDWGAWLMEDVGPNAADGNPLNTTMSFELSCRLAELQGASVSQVSVLVKGGCAEYRLESMRDKLAAALPLLEEAMAAQDVRGLKQFGRHRLEDLCEATERMCARLNAVGIPNTLIHNDLGLENIVLGATGYRFLDWDQAGVGNPLLALEQLRVQTPSSNVTSLLSGYRSWWSEALRGGEIDAGLTLVPPVAIAMQLVSYIASMASESSLRRLELRHLRILARQLDGALQGNKAFTRRTA